MTYDSKRAAVGQAYNLAVRDALTNKRENDVKYIYKKFLYYQALGNALQGADVETVQRVIENKEFDEAFKILNEKLK